MLLGSTLHHGFQLICLFVFVAGSQRQKEERQTDRLHIPPFFLISKHLHLVLQVLQAVLLGSTGQRQQVLPRTPAFVDRQVTAQALLRRLFLRLFGTVVEAVLSKGVESDPFGAVFVGADERQRAETREEELCRSGQVRRV